MKKFINKLLNVVGPLNQYSFFIGPNPSTSSNPNKSLPNIDSSAFIGAFSCIIGNVTLGKNVYISCNTTIRADEGSPFFISDCCNIEDNVVFHGDKNKFYLVNNTNYSIYIGKNTTCSHGSVVHGPCILGNNVFIGANATIFNAIVEDFCYVSPNSYVANGVRLHYNTFVPPGSVIENQADADLLAPVPMDLSDYSKDIINTSSDLASSYSSLLLDTKS